MRHASMDGRRDPTIMAGPAWRPLTHARAARSASYTRGHEPPGNSRGGERAVTAPTLAPAAFAAKWRGVTTTEKAASQEHFIDLCRMLGEPTPHEADPTGEHYAFEKRVSKAGGGDGFADAWKRDFFAWEYKGPRKDLKAAYSSGSRSTPTSPA